MATVARREMPKLVVAPDELGAWWGWWLPARLRARLVDEAIAREKARAKAGGGPRDSRE